MKRLALLSGLLLLAACPTEGPPRLFATNDFELAAANGARMNCTCLFVMNMPESFCRAWTKARPDVARWSYDPVKKRVESSVFVTWSAAAHWVDDKHGCILE